MAFEDIFGRVPLRKLFKPLFERLFDLDTGHNHDGVNSKAVVVGAVGDNMITNAMLAEDVKVGSLEALNTPAASITDAIDAVEMIADAAGAAAALAAAAAGAAADAAAEKYTLPAEGIPAESLAAAVQASLARADSAMQAATPLPTGTPVNAVAAEAELEIDGVVVHGETVTIGADVYEFVTDAAQSVSDPANIPVDIEGDTVKAQGTLTVDTQPAAGDAMIIGEKVYTFVPAGTANADGEVSIGTNLATAKTAIVAAINGTDGHNEPHPLVSAGTFAADACVITALIGGVAGNSIVTTETFTAGSNVFDAATLGTTTAGVDCVLGDAAAALVAAITASGTEPVTAVVEAGVVTVTADVRGAAANDIALDEDMANGAWDGANMAGGVDGTPGEQWEVAVDASYLYVCTAANDETGANWRRFTGASY